MARSTVGEADVRGPVRSVTAQDWVDAAAADFAVGGLATVRVEPLARRLGVTKGSFYWHFTDRGALLDAVVARWENEHTEAMIIEAQRGDLPAQKIRRLLVAVTARLGESRGEQLLYLQAEHEGVRSAVERVTTRRLDYLRDLMVELGVARPEAERRSALALSTAVGMEQLLTGAPGAMSRPSLGRGPFTDLLYDLLVAR